MKKNIAALLTVIALLVPSSRVFAQQWQALGPDDNTQLYPSYSYPFDVSFVNATPYVLFSAENSGNSTRVFFRQLNSSATAWQTVSNSPLVYASSITGAIAADNTPYVAYLNQLTGDKLCVKKQNLATLSWDFVGKQDFTAGAVKNETIAFNGQKVYAAFSDGANGNKLTVMKLNDDGVNWDIVGNAGFSVSTIDDISMAFVGATTYIAFRDYETGTPQVRLMTLNAAGTTWVDVAPAGLSTGSIGSMSFALNNSTPYLAFTLSTLSNNNTFVKKLNTAGTAWVDVATTPVPGIATNVKLQFDQSTPYITYNDYSNQYRATVFELNSTATTWQPVGNSDFSSGTAANSILRINNHQPYLIFSDGGFSQKARALTLNAAGTTWQDLTTSGFSATEPEFPNIVFNGGIPYVAYGEGINPQRATVMKFSGGQWQVVGTPRFTFQGTISSKMPLIFKGNVPYVAYMDGNQSNKLSVKRLNAAGTDWEQVGAAGFADGGKPGINLGINILTDGTTIYAAEGMVIMKLGAGDVWQSAAPAANDPGESVDNVSLTINNSTLYIVYRSLTNGGIKVKKMNGSGGWDAVGGGVFGASTVQSLSLVFNNSVPYVCSSQALYKLNATATGWDAIGSFSPSYGNLTYPQLAFEGNVPYISFSNALVAVEAEVIRYDAASNTWKNIGASNANIAAGQAFGSCLTIYNNQVYDVLDEGGAFVKVYGLNPVVSSFSPTTATAGASVTIKGKNFIDVTSVTFGGVAAKSYSIVSDSVMTAVVGTGASGNVAVTSSAGSAQLKGFVFAAGLPTISSFTPTQAAQNASVTITGINLSNTTAVSFGGVAAVSFKINSATSITAVVGNGKSGNVVVTTTTGSATLSGFTYLSPVAISSFSPVTAKAGTSVQITGTDFTGATAVTFGGQPAGLFTVNSATSITAIIGKGASGSVIVTTPNGTGTLAGFTFVSTPTPVISSFSPVEAAAGDTVVITGTDLGATTGVSFGGTPAASFLIKSATQVLAVVGKGSSGNISVTTATGTGALGGFSFTVQLPVNNFTVAVTGATCRGNADGKITINAAQALNYAAQITGNTINKTYAFSRSVTIDSLGAGTYSVCLTINNQPGYNSCYTLVVTEPKDLSVYSVLNGNNNTLNLRMNGGALYNITLNGKLYISTADSTVTIPLPYGVNDITVSTDKFCQGVVQKQVSIAGRLVPYPNPFQGLVSVNLGSKMAAKVTVDIQSVSDGKQVYANQYLERSGVLQVDLSGLANGIYIFHIVADNSDSAFKVVKK